MSDLVWSRDGGDWPNREASTFVEAAGIRWHVQRMGEGPLLLLLHGTGAATHSWRGLMPILARQFTVIAPDLPGHGFTQSPPAHRLSLPGMASDVSQLLRALDVKPEIVVGHSAGAAILARMCLDGKIAPRLLVSLNGAFMPFGGVANQLLSPLAQTARDESVGAAAVRLAGVERRGRRTADPEHRLEDRYAGHRALRQAGAQSRTCRSGAADDGELAACSRCCMICRG